MQRKSERFYVTFTLYSFNYLYDFRMSLLILFIIRFTGSRDPQLTVDENCSGFFNLRPKHLQILIFKQSF